MTEESSLALEFLKAIQEKGYKEMKQFVSKEGSRDKKTIVGSSGKRFTYWFAGIRPIHFYVQAEGSAKPVSLFQVPD